MDKAPIGIGSKWWVRPQYGFTIEEREGRICVSRIAPFNGNSMVITQEEVSALRSKKAIMHLYWKKIKQQKQKMMEDWNNVRASHG